ncbi:nuclear receptor subfamily 5 group A member 2-like [Spinachia spinachia]
MEFLHGAVVEEPCPVCGDKVSGYHYGLLTCESCKGFFKRTVQNNKKYTCAHSRGCRIDVSQRKRCPSCRFQKCLHVGMRLEAVRADRIRGGRNKFGPMYKRDRALKQQRKALIQASGVRKVSSPPLGTSTQLRDLPFSCDLHPVPILQCNPVPIAHSHGTSSLLPSDSPGIQQYQCTSSSNWTIKSEHGNNSAAGFDSDELYSRHLPLRGLRMPQLVTEFVRCDPDELQLQNKITARLLQEQTDCGKHGNPGNFGLMCLMADQTLFSIVEWARTSIFFKQLKVNDQMKLLHSCWSDLLLLDVISRQVLYGKEGSLLLVTGQEMQLSDVASNAGVAGLIQKGQELADKLHIIKVDRQEFACIKFIILFNADVQQLEDHQFIESVQEQAEGALLEYTLHTSSHLLGRFARLLLCRSELRSLSSLAEEYLYCKHLGGEVPCNNLLIELLHAKLGSNTQGLCECIKL